MFKTKQMINGMLISLTALGILSASALAEQDKIKHKVIEIKAQNNAPTILEIDNNGEHQVIELTNAEINDADVLSQALEMLDPETKAMIMNIMSNRMGDVNIELDPDAIVSDVEKELMLKLDVSGFDKEMFTDKKVIVINDGEGMKFEGLLRGHHKGIVSLIENGEFTVDELNEIRKALDAKY